MVVPFRGDAVAAERLMESLGRLELEPPDEIIVSDNSDGGVVVERSGVRVVRATMERSSYYARNAAVAAATTRESDRWLLFTDADCVPAPGLIRAYLAAEPDDDVGALAGLVIADFNQSHFLARYATDRGFLDQEAGVHTAEDAAATANLMVRRSAFDEIDGFEEGIRSGGDVDLCRRLVAAGWRIERRPEAIVTHLHRESLPDLLGAIARYGSGARWLNDRYPGSAPQWPLVPGLVGAARDAAINVARFRFEEAAFRGVDALGLVAHVVGYGRTNAAR